MWNPLTPEPQAQAELSLTVSPHCCSEPGQGQYQWIFWWIVWSWGLGSLDMRTDRIIQKIYYGWLKKFKNHWNGQKRQHIGLYLCLHIIVEILNTYQGVSYIYILYYIIYFFYRKKLSIDFGFHFIKVVWNMQIYIKNQTILGVFFFKCFSQLLSGSRQNCLEFSLWRTTLAPNLYLCVCIYMVEMQAMNILGYGTSGFQGGWM